MKSLSTILALAICCMIALPAMAGEVLTVAFDEKTQRMHTIYTNTDAEGNPVEVDVFMDYSYEGTCGAIEYYDPNTLGFEAAQIYEGIDKVWCSAWLEPSGLPLGSEMEFIAFAHILNEEGGIERTVQSSDMLIVKEAPVGSGRSDNDWGYAQGCAEEILPSIIDIGQSYCAKICHGSFSIPIFCEDPGYTPQLMQITIENGCGTDTECNTGCVGLEEFDDNFQSQVFVFPGCYLLLQLSYCGYDNNCICITRGDFYLPVEMNTFSALAGDNEVTLAWSTSSETDNDHFEIERDGETIARINSKGNTASGHSYSWIDNNVTNGTTYNYTLVSIDIEGNREVHTTEAATPAASLAPTSYALNQNYPNPFNSETTFSFSIPTAEHVTLTIYDVLGRQVASLVDAQLAAGTYTENFSASNLAAGVYMYTLQAGDFSQTKKMLFLK